MAPFCAVSLFMCVWYHIRALAKIPWLKLNLNELTPCCIKHTWRSWRYQGTKALHVQIHNIIISLSKNTTNVAQSIKRKSDGWHYRWIFMKIGVSAPPWTRGSYKVYFETETYWLFIFTSVYVCKWTGEINLAFWIYFWLVSCKK